MVVLGGYADELREAVLRAKRPAGELRARALAGLLAQKHHETLAAWGVDLVVPVPMHWLRRSLRGTSAADSIARGLAAAIGLPCVAALSRSRATRMQNELPSAERHGNVSGAFRPRRRLDGRRVLLVDDVTTTGATLDACRVAVAAAGASSVHAAVIARADAAEA